MNSSAFKPYKSEQFNGRQQFLRCMYATNEDFSLFLAQSSTIMCSPVIRTDDDDDNKQINLT